MHPCTTATFLQVKKGMPPGKEMEGLMKEHIHNDMLHRPCTLLA